MKTVIYNIGMLAGILPAGVRKLEGEQMGHVECLHDAYLVIEDGVIVGFGSGGTDVSGAPDSETESLPLRGPLPFTRPRAAMVSESAAPETSPESGNFSAHSETEYIETLQGL